MKQLLGYFLLLLWSSQLLSMVFGLGIIHGRNASDGEVPYLVSLRDEDNYHRCGGVILNEHWVLTSGHCIYFGQTKYKLKTMVYNTLLLSKGDTASIEKTLLHPKFAIGLYDIHNDIGLVRIATPIKLNQTNAKTATLPKASDHPKDGENLIISGWGATTTEPYWDLSNQLQIVTIPVLDDDKCLVLLKPEAVPFLMEEMMCAGEMVDQSKGQCHGDAGSPGTVNGVVQGLVSWRNRHCSVNPSVLTRVPPYLGWIQQVTGISTM